jgi:AraC-like DNA-binding protein
MQPPNVRWGSLGHGIHVMHVANSSERWRVFHETYCVAVVHGGAGRWQYRQRHQAIVPGALMLSEPGEVHVTTGVDSPGTFTSVFISDESLHSQFEGELAGKVHFDVAQVRACPEWLSLATRLAGWAEAVTVPNSASLAAESLVDDLVFAAGQLLARAGERALKPTRNCVARVARAHEAIVENYLARPNQRLDLASFAKELGVSRFWLTHSFRQQFGYSPTDLHTLQRLARVRQLLTSGGASLAAVAESAGYCDQAQMTRQFRKHWGLTPGAYQIAIGVRRAPAS